MTGIGPKCQLCGKGRQYHSTAMWNCPVGKRRKCRETGKISYESFNPGRTFLPKPPRMRTSKIPAKKKRGGSESRKSRATRRAVKAEPCVACGHPPGNEFNPVDVCHIRPFSVSQNDADWNCLSACRHHHNLQHAKGFLFMAKTFEGYAKALKKRGWEFIVNESTGDWSMFNPKEVALNLARRSV